MARRKRTPGLVKGLDLTARCKVMERAHTLLNQDAITFAQYSSILAMMQRLPFNAAIDDQYLAGEPAYKTIMDLLEQI